MSLESFFVDRPQITGFKGCSMDDNIIGLKLKSYIKDLELRRSQSITHSSSRNNNQ